MEDDYEEYEDMKFLSLIFSMTSVVMTIVGILVVYGVYVEGNLSKPIAITGILLVISGLSIVYVFTYIAIDQARRMNISEKKKVIH